MEDGLNNLHTKFETGLATIDEAQQISDLQQRNLRGNLSGEHQKDQGFLSLQLTIEEIQEYIKNKSIIVARNEGKIIGFWIMDFKTVIDERTNTILKNADAVKAIHKPLNEIKICKLRQVCVDEGYRGKDIPKLLYTTAQNELGKKFDFGFGYINKANERSMHTHIDKLGFIVVNELNIANEPWLRVLIPLHKNQELLDTLQKNAP